VQGVLFDGFAMEHFYLEDLGRSLGATSSDGCLAGQTNGEWGVGSGEWGFRENNMAKVNDTWVGALGMYMVDLAQVHALSQAQDRWFGQRA